MNSRPFRSVLLPLAALTGMSSGETLRFAPEAGRVLAKSFELTYSMELEDLEMEVAGEDIGAVIGVPEFMLEGASHFRFVDEYLESAGGRPLRFAREYDEASQDVEVIVAVLGQEQDMDASSVLPMEGLRVLFDWDAAAGRYALEFDEETPGDEGLLAHLAEETGMRSVLPARAVEEGDEWTVPSSVILQWLSPGGFLGIDPEDENLANLELEGFDELVTSMTQRAMDFYAELFDDTLRATHGGIREVDGRSLTRIDVEIEFSRTKDLMVFLEELIAEFLAMFPDEDMPEELFLDFARAELLLEVDGEAAIYWDHEANVLHSAQIDFVLVTEFGLELQVGVVDEQVEVLVEGTFSGPYEVRVTTD